MFGFNALGRWPLPARLFVRDGEKAGFFLRCEMSLLMWWTAPAPDPARATSRLRLARAHGRMMMMAWRPIPPGTCRFQWARHCAQNLEPA
jgi:hypothetical protein